MISAAGSVRQRGRVLGKSLLQTGCFGTAGAWTVEGRPSLLDLRRSLTMQQVWSKRKQPAFANCNFLWLWALGLWGLEQ
jgi:hypothetical protein